MTRPDASNLATRLSREAEAVCRRYLDAGRRQGDYWQVGDARNTPGRSMFVRLKETANGPAGKWTDAATGEHGDLLDIIRESKGLIAFRDVLAEARRFLADPRPQTMDQGARVSTQTGSPEAAKRLFHASVPLGGTLAEAYLRQRGIMRSHESPALRLHPRCYYGGTDPMQRKTWPALVAAVSDLGGGLTGVHRIYLDPNGFSPSRLGKAPVECPKRSLGRIKGHGVHIGQRAEIMAAGEGLETVMSLKDVLPGMSMISALSSLHLAELVLPPGVRYLYIAQDNDPAGFHAAKRLAQRAATLGIEARLLTPVGGDFNDDLRLLGPRSLAGTLAKQLIHDHADRFLDPACPLSAQGSANDVLAPRRLKGDPHNESLDAQAFKEGD
jgi:hypothetical protein